VKYSLNAEQGSTSAQAPNGKSPDGEIGRRSGLKIRSPSMGVGVQVPLRAPIWSELTHSK
jgi:hypothetical protein